MSEITKRKLKTDVGKDVAALRRQSSPVVNVEGHANGGGKHAACESAEKAATAPLQRQQVREKSKGKNDYDHHLPSVSASSFSLRAHFFRDSYYTAFLQTPSLYRSCIEPRLEATTFAAPGCGEVRVLCAFFICEGHKKTNRRIVAVARDWVGAFAFFFLEPFSETKEAVVLAAYPLLESVKMSFESSREVVFFLDGIDFMFFMEDQKQAKWLQDALRAAMVSMYGKGNDTERIVNMRAYSVEFASHYRGELVATAIKPLNTVFATFVGDNDAALMRNKLVELRDCLIRVSQIRDKVAQLWLKSTDELIYKGAASSACTLKNHLRVVEELILCPTLYGDASFSEKISKCLEEIGDRFPEFAARCSRVAVFLDYTDRTMLKWKSRNEVPDISFEPCFEPERGSQAAAYEALLLKERFEKNAPTHHHKPGIYLVVLCFCGDKVFTDSSGNWITELIHSEPTHEELRQLTADSEDYQWILRLGGADADWAAGGSFRAWADLYKERGRESFKARFIQAAAKMQQRGLFPRLGCVFDTPILQEKAGSALIFTLSGVDSESIISSAAGVWRNICDLEPSKYTDFLMCSESARLAFLSGSYRCCVRYLSAAKMYYKSFLERLSPGFYIGFFIASVATAGTLMLVPECNRNLPPLVKVSAEKSLSLLQLRWLQSLNYRKERKGTFGLPALADIFMPINDNLPFENKVAYAVTVLEAAVGLKVEKFYDLEIFVLDEEQTIYAFFAVAYYPPPLQDSGGAIEAPPNGLVPMTFKLLSVVDDHHHRRYWSSVYGFFADEANVRYRKLCVAPPLYTSDEVVRLRLVNEKMLYAMDLDKYLFLFSWARALAVWLEMDGLTLVQKHAGDFLKVAAAATKGDGEKEGEKENKRESKPRGALMSVEEVVEIAVSNQAAATDSNMFLMKSLLLQLVTADKHEFASILQRVQSIDDSMAKHHANYLVSTEKGNREPVATLRGFDEVPMDYNFSAVRPASVFELPCTLMEFVSGGANIAELYIFACEIVDEVIELAISGGEAAVVGRVAERMVSCVEAAEDIVDGAAFEGLRTEIEEMAWAKRELFLQEWRERFNVGFALPALDDEGLDKAMKESKLPFYEGSSLFMRSSSEALRVCLARAAGDAKQLQELLCVANSALHVIDLGSCLHSYSDVFQKSKRGFCHGNDGNSEECSVDVKTDISTTNVAAAASTNAKVQILVTLISRDQREIPLYLLDPLRCLFFSGDKPTRLHFSNFSYSVLFVFGNHMNAARSEVAAQLYDLALVEKERQSTLLDMAIQLQAPLLALRLFSLIYGFDYDRFNEEGARYVHERVTTKGNFFFVYSIEDWFYIEDLGGPSVASAFDVLWWLRYLREVGAAHCNYSSHGGAWKKVYAETRVSMFLSLGVGSITEDETGLWLKWFGPLVSHVSLKGESGVTDAEVSVLTAVFPMLRSVDISCTAVTDESVRLLCARCKQLVECNVADCRISCEGVVHMKEICKVNVENL